jgi:hypothetical protein
MEITQDLIRELFFYEEGKLFHRTQRNNNIKVGEEAGCLRTNGYKAIGINRKQYFSHRLIYIYHNGEITDGLHIDHFDRNRLNNNIENLRLVTRQENQFNRGAKGYSFRKAINKFEARIKLNGKQMHLGLFDTTEEAETAYLKAKNEFHTIKERITNE